MDTEFTGPRAGCPVCNQPHRIDANGALRDHRGREIGTMPRCAGSGARTRRQALESFAWVCVNRADYAIEYREHYSQKGRIGEMARFLPKLVKYGSLLRKTLEKLGRDPSEAERAILAELDKVG